MRNQNQPHRPLVNVILLTGLGLFGVSLVASAEPNIALNMQVMNTVSKQVISSVNQTGTMSNLLTAHKSAMYQALNSIGIKAENLPAALQQTLNKPATTSLQALVAYSIGVDHLDKGDFQAAQNAFKQAAIADSFFTEAIKAALSTPNERMSIHQLQQNSQSQSMTRANSMLSGSVSMGSTLPSSPPPPIQTNQGQSKSMDVKADVAKILDDVKKTSDKMNEVAELVKQNPEKASSIMAEAVNSGGLSPELALSSALSGVKLPDQASIKSLINTASGLGLTQAGMNFVANDIHAQTGGCK